MAKTAKRWHPAEAEAWRPPAKLTVSAWADRHRVLDEGAAEPGNYRTDRTPYAREWMDNATLPWVEQTTICKGTQIGGTEILNNVVGFAVHQDPGPIMMVMPRKDDAALIGRQRIKPMVLASPALTGQMTDRAHDWTKRELVFRRCVLYLRSAQSPAELASVPVRYLLCDEVDKWPAWSGKEASPFDLARERTRTYYNRVIYLTSTPTIRGGLISQEFERGDRRRYWVPCPHCGAHQVLRWKRIRWPEHVRTRETMLQERCASYVCEHCDEEIHDREKRSMLDKGRWCPADTTPATYDPESDRHTHRSYHIWAAYSPWLSWSDIAATFLASRGDPARMMNFVNSWLAEPWEEKVEAPTKDSLTKCVQAGHRRDQVPEQAVVLTAGVDVQKDHLPYVIRAWGSDEESWLVRADAARDFGELDDILWRNVWGEQKMLVRCVLVDMRYRTEEVLDLVRAHPESAHPIRGVEKDSPMPFSTQKLERHPVTGQPYKRATLVWHVNVGHFKDWLAGRIFGRDDTTLRAWHLHEDPADDYLVQMSAEQKVLERTGGRVKERWILKPGHERNDWWDCEVYALAAARMIHVERLRSATRPAERPHRKARPARRPGGALDYVRRLQGR